MKFTCLQENLASKLSTVNRAVATKGSLSILSNILVTAEKNRVKLSATDLKMSISTWVGASVDEAGSITVPGAILTNFITALTPQKLHFETKKHVLKIETQQGWAQINGAGSDDFPQIETTFSNPWLKLKASPVRKALSEVIFAAASDEGRPILTGILFSSAVGSDRLTLVGVDGFRLSESIVTQPEPFKSALKLVIPAKTLNELNRLLGEEEELELGLKEKESEILFRIPETLLSARLLEGEFPDYKQILPKGFKVEAILPREDFRKAIRLSSIFAETSSNVVKIKISPTDSRITVSANTQEVGDSVTHIEADIKGEEETIAFNTKYLMDVLGSLGAEQINLSVQDSLSPGMLSPVGDDTYRHVIMPVRLQGG